MKRFIVKGLTATILVVALVFPPVTSVFAASPGTQGQPGQTCLSSTAPVSQGRQPVLLDQHLMRRAQEQLALSTPATAYQLRQPIAPMLSLSMMWPASRCHNPIRSNRHKHNAQAEEPVTYGESGYSTDWIPAFVRS